MKKDLQKFTSTFLALLLLSVQTIAYAGNSAVINTEEEISTVTNFDETEIYSAFDEVEELVATLENDAEITYSEIEAKSSDLVANVSSNSSAITSNTYNSTPIVSAFWYGCLLWIPGVIIVGIITGFESSEIARAGWGCLITSLLGGTGIWGLRLQ